MGMSNDAAARAYASDCDAMYADELSNSQYDAIELRL